MKKVFLLLLSSSFFVTTYAQRGYVERAIEKNYEKKYGEPGAQKGNDWFNNHLLNVDVADTYTFPTYVKMHMTSYRNGEVRDENEIQYYFNKDGTIIGFKAQNDNKKRKEDQFIIYDYVKNAMIMLNEKDHTAMAININAFRSKEAIEKRNHTATSDKAYNSNTDCKSMGKTKTIRGYSCVGYVCTNTERNTRSEIWITTKIPIQTHNMDARNPLAAYYGGKNYGGMIMEGNFYEDGELSSTIEVLEVNTAANYTVKTKDYTFNKM